MDNGSKSVTDADSVNGSAQNGAEDKDLQNAQTTEEEVEDTDEIVAAGEANPFEKMAFGFKKRIGKLTSQKKERDEQIARLQAEIESMKKSAKPKNEGSKIDSISDQSELSAYLDDAKNERTRMLEALESEDSEIDIDGKMYSRKDILGYVKKLDEIIGNQIPARMQKLKQLDLKKQKKSEVEKLAKKTFPELEDEGSPMSQWVNAQLEDEFLQENLSILLAYAFKGLNVSRLREKIAKIGKSDKPANAASSDNPAEDKDDMPEFKPGKRLSLEEARKFF